MLSKAEERKIRMDAEVVNANTARKTQDEFERLRAMLLDDTLARLHLLEADNHQLQREYEQLWGEHEEGRRRHESLLAELTQLRLKIEDRESFTSALEPVIANTLERKIATAGEEMAEVVAPLMAPAIKQQIHESKDEMVEALHPIIGQTVKRAVTEAMRKLIKQINQRLDRAFNMQGTWRRLKARLTGVPAPLAVLPQVLPFTVEEVFLISRKSGLLMAHVSGQEQNEGDEARAQMVSSMLTAIQDFIQDIYGQAETSDVHEFKDADRVSFVMASPLMFLAAVTATHDEPPRNFSDLLERLLNKIQNTCLHAIVHFDGDTAAMADARQHMQRFIQAFEATPKIPVPKREVPSRAVRIAWGGLGVVALASLAWFLLKLSLPTGPAPALLEATTSSLAPGVMPFRLEARMHGEVWMRVFDGNGDSTVYKDFRFQTGEVYAWRATGRMRMRIGNAGETELYLDGENLGKLGEVHQPVSLVISSEGIQQKSESAMP